MIASLLLPVLGITMPPVELYARRLILVRAPGASDVAALSTHIEKQHAADVRYIMASSAELELDRDSLSYLIIHKLPQDSQNTVGKKGK